MGSITSADSAGALILRTRASQRAAILVAPDGISHRLQDAGERIVDFKEDAAHDLGKRVNALGAMMKKHPLLSIGIGARPVERASRSATCSLSGRNLVGPHLEACARRRLGVRRGRTQVRSSIHGRGGEWPTLGPRGLTDGKSWTRRFCTPPRCRSRRCANSHLDAPRASLYDGV
jgi:hypothetical protein